MSRFAAALTVSLALCLPTALAIGTPQTAQPHLSHDAPFVGQVLTLEVSGAAALAPTRLYFSSQAGSHATPYGVLELQRGDLVLLASGTTNGAGTCSFDVPVPLDPALAEEGAHFQALVVDPSAPAGKVFSDAVHARFLGPRIYAGFRGVRPSNEPDRFVRTGMYVFSAVDDAIVARVDYGSSNEPGGPRGEGKPVFSSSFARGAVMSARRELVLFDPFFGAVLGRVGFATECSRKLVVDSARRQVYVLELGGPGPARLHAIDLATGAPTGHLDLPGAMEPLWCVDDAGAEVFVAELDPGGRTAIRRVGLDPLIDRGSTSVGVPNSRAFRDVAYSTGQVFVSTMDTLSHFIYDTGNLTRCRPTPTGVGIRVTDLGFNQMRLLSPMASIDRLLASSNVTDFPGPIFGLRELPLSTFGPPTAIGHPPSALDFIVSEIEPDGALVWILYEKEYHHGHFLYRLDVPSRSWTEVPFYSPPVGYSDAEPLRDAWNHEVWISNQGHGAPYDIDPEIFVVDELHGSSRTIPLAHTAEVMHAVPLP